MINFFGHHGRETEATAQGGHVKMLFKNLMPKIAAGLNFSKSTSRICEASLSTLVSAYSALNSHLFSMEMLYSCKFVTQISAS